MASIVETMVPIPKGRSKNMPESIFTSKKHVCDERDNSVICTCFNILALFDIFILYFLHSRLASLKLDLFYCTSELHSIQICYCVRLMKIGQVTVESVYNNL